MARGDCCFIYHALSQACEVVGDGCARFGSGSGEHHVVGVECHHVKVRHGREVVGREKFAHLRREAVVDEVDCHGLAVVTFLPLGKALDVLVLLLVDPPDAEYLALEHEIVVAIVAVVGHPIDLNRVEVPEAKPIANVAIVVGATAQCQ